MKKINAYTLMEVAVAMLLSAIVVTICYSAYGIITNYYSTFQKKNQTADVVLSLKHVLERDFLKSKYILKNDTGFELTQDSSKIYYTFNQNWVTRKWNELHTDTFKLETTVLTTYFEDQPVVVPDTIDRINFNIILAKKMIVPVQVNKLYSAENLFR